MLKDDKLETDQFSWLAKDITRGIIGEKEAKCDKYTENFIKFTWNEMSVISIKFINKFIGINSEII